MRRAIRVRRGHENAALTEQAPAVLVGELDATEVVAAHGRHTVVQRQPLVQKRVLAVEQLEHTVIFEQHTRNEQLDLAREGIA